MKWFSFAAELLTPLPAPEPPKTRTISIECHATDAVEVRAANIVTFLGYLGGGGGSFSIPQISPQEATLRIITVLRKYEEVDRALAP